MFSNRIAMSVCVRAVVLLFLAGPTSQAFAAHWWDIAGTGAWEVPANWGEPHGTPKTTPPTAGSTVVIGDTTVDNPIVQLSTAGQLARRVWVGYSNGSTGTLEFLGGSLNTGLSGDAASGPLQVGYAGTGLVNHVDGTVTLGVHSGNDATLDLGLYATGVGTYNLEGGTLTTGAVARGTGTGTFNFDGGTLKAGATNTTFMEGLTNAYIKADGATVHTGGFDVTIAQPLLDGGGGGGLSKTGTGTLTLSGTNTYTGTTTIGEGVLSISTPGNLGPGDIILDGGTLQTTGDPMSIYNNITLTDDSVLDIRTSGSRVANFRGVIGDGAGTFGFTKTGSGYLYLSGNNTYDGDSVLSGVVYLANSNALGSTVGGTTMNSGGTLTLTSNGMVVNENLSMAGTLRMYPSSGGCTYAGDITLTGNVTLSAKYAGTTLDITGDVGGDYGLIVNNNVGMARLGGTSTYTGTTTLKRSTLFIGADAPNGAAGALGNATSAVQLGGSGTPVADQMALLTDGAYTVGRDLAVNDQNSSGTTTIGGSQTSGASTFSGDITLNRDVILTSANTDANAVTFSGVIDDGASTYGITKAGVGTVVLGGTNSYDGATTIGEGVLSISSAGNLGTGNIILDGGTLQTTGSSNVTLYNNITLTADGFLDIDAASNTYLRGVIDDGAGTFGITKSGTWNLQLFGNNTYDGETVLSGNVYIGHSNALGSTVGGTTMTGGTLTLISNGLVVNENLSIAGTLRMYPSVGATYAGDITLTGSTAISAKYAGTIYDITGDVSGDYGLTINNEPGTTRLGGTNTYTGTTTVRRSTLLVGSDAPNGAAGALGNATSAVQMGRSGTNHDVALLTDGAFTVGRDIVVNGYNPAGTSTIGGNQTTGASTFSGNITLERDVILASANTDGNAVTFSGQISGTGFGVTKAGVGTVVLADENTYTGATAVDSGTLVVDGSIASSSGLSLAAGTMLEGHGTVPTIGGAGLVSPGNSPGILTAASIDPTGGLDFALEFTSLGSPDYTDPLASVNDVLRLTDASDPLVAALDGTNTIGVYFDASLIAEDDVFRGGFYTDRNADFADLIAGASFAYYLSGDGGGTHDLNGQAYYTLAEYNASMGFNVTTVAEVANFGAGDIDGYVMQLTATVPEPSTIALLSLGLLGLPLVGRRRKR